VLPNAMSADDIESGWGGGWAFFNFYHLPPLPPPASIMIRLDGERPAEGKAGR
jgi:hypothetical protein